jgi:hypothetical protein
VKKLRNLAALIGLVFMVTGILALFIAFPIGLCVYGILFIVHGSTMSGILCLTFGVTIFGIGTVWANNNQ